MFDAMGLLNEKNIELEAKVAKLEQSERILEKASLKHLNRAEEAEAKVATLEAENTHMKTALRDISSCQQLISCQSIAKWALKEASE